MDGARDELFAGAILTRDEHTSRRLCDALDLIDHCAHGIRTTDNLITRLDRFAEPRVFFVEIEMLERVSECDENPVRVERLLEDVVRPQLRRLDGSLDRRVATDHHDDRAGVMLLDPPQRLEAVDARHLDVEKDEMRLPLFVFAYPIDGVGDGADLVPLELEQLPERGANPLLVVDDENASHEGYLMVAKARPPQNPRNACSLIVGRSYRASYDRWIFGRLQGSPERRWAARPGRAHPVAIPAPSGAECAGSSPTEC